MLTKEQLKIISDRALEDEDLSLQLWQDIEDLINEVKLLQEALKFYAACPMYTTDGTEYSYDSGSFEEDRGTIARAILNKYKT